MSYPSNYVTREQLQKLQRLLQTKLQKLASVQTKDSDSELSEEILKFVNFLVDKQMCVFDAPVYQPSQQWQYHYSTNTTIPPHLNSNNVPQHSSGLGNVKPNTICTVCWENSHGHHTHCTHMFMNDAGDVNDL